MEEWNGVSLDKETKYFFSVSFGEGNRVVEVSYTSAGKTKSEDLKMSFEFDRATLEGVKKTVWLKNGGGTFVRVDRQTRTETSLAIESMTLFLLGPRCVFGIDLPHVLLHELRVQKRQLANLAAR